MKEIPCSCFFNILQTEHLASQLKVIYWSCMSTEYIHHHRQMATGLRRITWPLAIVAVWSQWLAANSLSRVPDCWRPSQTTSSLQTGVGGAPDRRRIRLVGTRWASTIPSGWTPMWSVATEMSRRRNCVLVLPGFHRSAQTPIGSGRHQ